MRSFERGLHEKELRPVSHVTTQILVVPCIRLHVSPGQRHVRRGRCRCRRCLTDTREALPKLQEVRLTGRQVGRLHRRPAMAGGLRPHANRLRLRRRRPGRGRPRATRHRGLAPQARRRQGLERGPPGAEGLIRSGTHAAARCDNEHGATIMMRILASRHARIIAGILDRHDYSFSARAHHPKRFAACTDRRCQPARQTETPSESSTSTIIHSEMAGTIQSGSRHARIVAAPAIQLSGREVRGRNRV